MAATLVKSAIQTATAANQAATLLGLPSPGEWAVQLTGTWSGTVTFEATVDGTTWVATQMYPSTSLTTASLTSTATANGVFVNAAGAYAGLRARFSTATSGSVVMTVRYSAY